MNFLNYFGFEEYLSGLTGFMAFLVFLGLYLVTRNAIIRSWLKYFHFAMGFMALTYFLPFSLGLLSVIILEGLSDKYFGIVYIASFSIPLLLALICLIMVYKKRGNI